MFAHGAEFERDPERYKLALATTAAELTMVHKFLKYVDALGLHVPGREMIPVPGPDGYREFDFITPLMSEPSTVGCAIGTRPANVAGFALARHHGVPCRLLDWTENPLCAAFFASWSPSAGTKSGCIAVWALNMKLFRENPKGWWVLDVFRNDVGFLNAQEGVLMYRACGERAFVREGEWPSLDKEHPDALVKITLPVEEVSSLRRLLRIERIDAPFLMPSFETIRSTVVEMMMAETGYHASSP